MAISNDLAIRDEQRALTTADPEQAATALAHILATGDLSKLTDSQRVAHYLNQCDSLGLNPISRPFDWLILDSKLVLYPNKSCAEQLRRNHHISVKVTRREIVGDLFCVEVEGRTPNGRTDEATKYVPLKNSRGEKLTGTNLANAFAKAETGAKRRLVISMVGLSSPPDPDEMTGVKFVVVDGTGRVLDNPTPEQKALAADPTMARVIGERTFETVGQAADAPLAGAHDQRPRADEVERSQPKANPVPLRCDAPAARAAYFAAVADTELATDEGRAAFIAEYTSRYSPALRTDSLSRFLAHSTERQARELVQAASVRAESLRQAQPVTASQQEHADPKVHASVVLTGGGQRDEGPPVFEGGALASGRPENGREYSPDEWRTFYRAWAAELRARDTAYTIWPENQIKRATVGQLIEETMSCIGQCDSLDEMAALADLDERRQDDQAESEGADAETAEAF